MDTAWAVPLCRAKKHAAQEVQYPCVKEYYTLTDTRIRNWVYPLIKGHWTFWVCKSGSVYETSHLFGI